MRPDPYEPYELVLNVLRGPFRLSRSGIVPQRPEQLTLLLPNHEPSAWLSHQRAGGSLVRWFEADRGELREFPALVREAVTQPDRLVEGNETGEDFNLWILSGSARGRSFSRAIEFVEPGERWTPLGEKIRTALDRLVALAAGPPSRGEGPAGKDRGAQSRPVADHVYCVACGALNPVSSNDTEAGL